MRTKQWKQSISKFIFSDTTSPFVFLGILILCFGIFIPAWGFYFDDWPMIYLIKSHGNIIQYYQYDRPFAAWTDIILKTVLGTNPVAWQVAILLARWLTVIGFWWCIRLIWPQAKRLVFSAAILFTIYPAIFLQPMAVTFTHIFLWYAFYFFSMGLMILANRHPRQFHLLTVFALLIGAVQIWSVEYFWGLELLRPIVLWIIRSDEKISWKKKLSAVGINWLPYLILLLSAIIWRFFFSNLSTDSGHFLVDPNTPTLLLMLSKSPLSAIIKLAQFCYSDIFYLMIGVWIKTIQTKMVSHSMLSNLILQGITLLTALFVGFFFSKTHKTQLDETVSTVSHIECQFLLVGICAILVGMIPLWATGRHIVLLENYFVDYFALPSIPGASLLLAGLISRLISKWPYKVIILAVFVGLAAKYFINSGNEYRYDWISQKSFYWQLSWRIPNITPGTYLLSETDIFEYAPDYSVTAAINILYGVPDKTTDLPYWFFTSNDLPYPTGTFPNQLFTNTELHQTLRTLSFTAPTKNGILVSYESGGMRCLWVLSTTDASNPHISQEMVDALELSNLSAILPEVYQSHPDENIFGPEPPHNWCYYFQKASLARQFGNWEEVTNLGNQVIALGFDPSDYYEWIPFIEGYIHQRDWERAQDLTHATFDKNARLQASLCAAWDRALQTTSLDSSDEEIVNPFLKEIGCTPQ